MSTPRQQVRHKTCRVEKVETLSRFRFAVTLACGTVKLRECANAPTLKSMACCGQVPPGHSVRGVGR